MCSQYILDCPCITVHNHNIFRNLNEQMSVLIIVVVALTLLMSGGIMLRIVIKSIRARREYVRLAQDDEYEDDRGRYVVV